MKFTAQKFSKPRRSVRNALNEMESWKIPVDNLL